MKEAALVTPAAVEPVELTDVLAHLRIDHHHDDEAIGRLIAAATAECQEFTGLQLITATFRQDLDAFPTQPIMLLPAPLAAVSSIKYRDADDVEQTLATSVYEVDTSARPGEVQLRTGQAWPTTKIRANAVSITFTAGFGSTPASVPQGVKLAIKMLAGSFYDEKGDNAVARGLDPASTLWRLLRPHRLTLVPRSG